MEVPLWLQRRLSQILEKAIHLHLNWLFQFFTFQ